MNIKPLILMVLLLASAFQVQAANAPPPPPPGLFGADPGSDLWREVRQRDGEVRGISQVKSTDAEVLINVSGQSWREYRMEKLIPFTGVAIVVLLAVILVFRFLRGRIPLENGRSDKKIQRFSDMQRLAHWSTAILFVILGITGLTLLLGRSVLIPMFGAEAFSSIATAGRLVHNYLGPLFIVSLTFLFVLFVKENLPSPKLDFQWVMRGGGLFGYHAHADRYNAGEKLWFWAAVVFGLALVISGVILAFPFFDQTRATMEFYHWVHSVSAVVIILFSFGHIYMGTVALEATFEVMRTGYCDANWAKEHHDLWYEKVKDTAVDADAIRQDSSPAPRRTADST